MSSPAKSAADRLWTIGHSNRPLADFLALLRANEIELVADVRRIPASRRHPHFSRERLSAALAGAGIGYVHVVELGGHREPRADSANVGWPAGPFRGYADHLATAEFRRGLERLRALAAEKRVAAMCAEGRWQDCHRRLLADRWVSDGGLVVHLAVGVEPVTHVVDARVRVVDGELVYGQEEGGLFG